MVKSTLNRNQKQLAKLTLSESRALLVEIVAVLDGTEWSPGTPEEIARLLVVAGIEIREP